MRETEKRSPSGNIKIKQKILIEDERGGETWSAVRYTDGGMIFLLDKEYAIKGKKFGENNNYNVSNGRKVATTCSPTKRIQSVLSEDSFVPLKIDLLSSDGFKDYGVCKGDLAGIMNYDMYRSNRVVIDPSYMCLSTPESTPSGTGSYYFLCVGSGGSVHHYGCDWRGGGSIRPFCIIKSNILSSLLKA